MLTMCYDIKVVFSKIVDNLTDSDDNFVSLFVSHILLLEVIYSDFLFAKITTLDYNIALISPSDFSKMFTIFNLFILVVLLT